jgi:hypothetical protein
MLSYEFLRSLEIKKELLPQAYQFPKDKSFDGSTEREPGARPFSKIYEVGRDEFNRAVWDEDPGRINYYEHDEGVILLLCPEKAPLDPLLMLRLSVILGICWRQEYPGDRAISWSARAKIPTADTHARGDIQGDADCRARKAITFGHLPHHGPN